MGFASRGVWFMGYCGCMGYEAVFPANQLGGLKNVWNLREYGVCEPWVTRESTVTYDVNLERATRSFSLSSRSQASIQRGNGI